jgi:2-methylisocitrate lyase-like PEP mutase family enzyme
VTGGVPSRGDRLRRDLSGGQAVPAIGVYDTFSATLVARREVALFLSGFSFAASFYGLPDFGFIAWADLVAFAQRVRTVVPERHIVVDIDDGYGDDRVAAHVTRLLRDAGASAVVLEDQRRPRRCGHLAGKLLRDLDEHLRRLDAVRAAAGDIVVVARTDAVDRADVRRRTAAFVDAGADAVLVDGVGDLNLVEELAAALGVPLVFNQLAGGKSPVVGLKELASRGVSLVLYSTVPLFAAHRAVDERLDELLDYDGRLDAITRSVTLEPCNEVLEENLATLASVPSGA